MSIYRFDICDKEGRVLRAINRDCNSETEAKRFARDYLGRADRDIDAIEVWEGRKVFFRIRRQDSD